MRSVLLRVGLSLGVAVAVIIGWTAASSAPPPTELFISLSTDGTCAPIGQDTISITSATTVTLCHHMTNNTGDVIPIHTLENALTGLILFEDEFELDKDETFTAQIDAPFDSTKTIEASWTSQDQGGQDFLAAAQAQVVLECPTTVYVDESATGEKNGLSWVDAFPDLQDGLDLAKTCALVTEVQVAEGTYLPDRGTGDRTLSFDLPSDVTVEGGYAPGGSTNPVGALTVLSGDLDGNDNTNLEHTEPTRSENSYRILNTLTATNVELIGVTVADGNANGTGSNADWPAGEVGHITTVFDDVTVTDHTASGDGGLQMFGTFKNGIVTNNTSDGDGGGLWAENGTTVINSEITHNSTSGSGGGLSVAGRVQIVNTVIASNTAREGGGVQIDGAGTFLYFDNVTIAENSAELIGGTVYVPGLFAATPITFDNSIIWGNTSSLGPSINALASNVTLTNTTTQDLGQTGFSSGPNNSTADPLFTNPAVGDYTLQLTSPAINGGDNTLLPPDGTDVDNDGNTTEVLPVDLDGNNRITNGIVDMGAHERPSDGVTVFADPVVCYDSGDPGAGGTFIGGEVRTIDVAGAGECVPAGASSVIFTVSSINPLTEGNLRMTPAGVVATGGAGVVNYGAANGLNNTNTVTVPLSASGQVDIEANSGPAGAVPTTDVRLLAVGYYSPDVDPATKFFALNPCAVADSRTNKGADINFNGPNNDGYWPVGAAFPDIDVVGTFPAGQGGGNTDCGVPAGADAVLVNIVTIAPTGDSGFISAGPGGTDPGVEAVTSFAPLTPVVAGGFNNGATTILPLNGGQTIALDIDGNVGAQTRLRVEVLGYYDTDPTGLDFTPLSPCAVFDSRPNKGGAGIYGDNRLHGINNTTTYQISGDTVPVDQGGIVGTPGGVGTCDVPDGTQAVLINLEAVNALQEGNLWVAAATASPGAATTGGVLNFNNVNPKMNNANAVVVPLNADGKIDLEVNAGSFTADGTPISEARGVVLGYYN